MRKRVNLLLVFIMGLIIISACGKTEKATSEDVSKTDNKEENTQKMMLDKDWVQKDSSLSDDTFFAASISNNSIEVYWIYNEGKSKTIYWSGSYMAPENEQKEFSWISKKEKSLTDGYYTSATDEEKTFVYKDGELSFSAKDYEYSTDIVLVVSDVDYVGTAVDKGDFKKIAVDESDDIATNIDAATSFPEKMEYGEVYNENGVSIVFKGYVHSKDECYVALEINNSTDKTITVNEESYSVNGTMFPGYIRDDIEYLLSFTISPGKKVNKKIDVRWVLENLLNENNRDVKTIDVLFNAFDDDTYDTICMPYIHLETDINNDENEFIDYPEFYNDEKIKLDLMDVSEKEIMIRLTNNTDEWTEYQLNTVDINGYTANLYDDFDTNCVGYFCFSKSVSLVTIEVNDSFMKDNGIDSISELVFGFSCYPKRDYSREFVKEGITVNVDEDGNISK